MIDELMNLLDEREDLMDELELLDLKIQVLVNKMKQPIKEIHVVKSFKTNWIRDI